MSFGSFHLPSVNELLESPPLAGLVRSVSQNRMVTAVRRVLDELRHEAQSAASNRRVPTIQEIAERIARRVVLEQVPSARGVINASGRLWGEGIGPPPLADDAIGEVLASSRDYAALATVPEKVELAPYSAAVESLLCEVSGAEAALVAASHAGALLLALAALGEKREVVVSRGQLFEVEDGCRLDTLAAAAGARLREVGAVDKTLAADYEAVLSEGTTALFWMSSDGGGCGGSRGSLAAAELIEVGRRYNVPVLVAAGRCAWTDLNALGCPSGIVVPELVQAGAAMVVARGDGFFGGPTCGLVVGQRQWLEPLHRHPLATPLAAGRLTEAALLATLRHYRRPEQLRDVLPPLQVMAVDEQNLRQRAARLAPQVASCAAVAQTEVLALPATFPAGHRRQPSWGIAVHPEGQSAQGLADALRRAQPPLIVEMEGERLIVDLRTVFPRQDMDLVEAFVSISPREPPPVEG